MKRRVADIIVDILIENKITDCFSVVGGGAMHLNNALVVNEDMNLVYNHHEQACAMAATAYGRLKGKPAVVCVTSGPGGLNTLNGVQGAWVDSIPMIVISGHPRMATTIQSTGLNLRCRGVQENDIIYMVKKITKYSVLLTDPQKVRAEMEKAIYYAMEGRRGPVWIDVPLDIQGVEVEVEELEGWSSSKEKSDIPDKEIGALEELLLNASRPCILTGSAIRTADAVELFRQFIDKVQIPIVGGSLRADICHNEQERYYGMSGSIGPRAGNFILQNSDLILVLGNSLSFQQTGFYQEGFAPKAKIIMVDIQEDEAKKPGLHVDMLIHMEIKAFFENYIRNRKEIKATEKWIDYCEYVKNYFPKYEALKNYGTLSSEERVPALLFWKLLLPKIQNDALIALGNSSCIHGVLQEGIEKKEQRVIVNYNCGSMGDDLPAAIGMAVASDAMVYCVTGDGSIMMNLQELQTIVHHVYPIKICLFLNDGYGAIRNTCSNFFHGVYTGCDEKSGISFPSFAKVAEAFGIKCRECKNVGMLESSLEWYIAESGPCILLIDEMLDEIRGPKIESKLLSNGEFVTPPLHDMSPFMEEKEMGKLMISESTGECV